MIITNFFPVLVLTAFLITKSLIYVDICFFTSIYTFPTICRWHWGNVFRNLIGMHTWTLAEFGEGQRGAVVNCDQYLPII